MSKKYYALDYSEKVIVTQKFRRLTPERIKLSVKPYNKIKSALSFKKRKEKKTNWNKNQTLLKKVFIRSGTVNNATNITHQTEIHDIKTLETKHCLIKDDEPHQEFLQLLNLKKKKTFHTYAQNQILHAAVCNEDFEGLYTRYFVIRDIKWCFNGFDVIIKITLYS